MITIRTERPIVGMVEQVGARRKPTFTPVDRDRKPLPPIAYTPLTFHIGDQEHVLALHREVSTVLPERRRQWVLSHPIIGALVCRIRAHYKGVPVSSAHYTLAEAKAAALESIDTLVALRGPDAINNRFAREIAECAQS